MIRPIVASPWCRSRADARNSGAGGTYRRTQFYLEWLWCLPMAPMLPIRPWLEISANLVSIATLRKDIHRLRQGGKRHDKLSRSWSFRGQSKTLNIEDVQHGAIGYFFARTLCDCFSQQTFELLKIIDLGADVIKIARGNVANIGA